MGIQEKLFNNTAMVSMIPDMDNKSIFNEPLITLFIDGQKIKDFDTYSQCCDHLMMILES